MELKSPLTFRLGLPDDFLKEVYGSEVPKSFVPSMPNLNYNHENEKPALFTIDLHKILNWLRDNELPKSLEREFCDIPVLLFAPEFSIDHLLFHYDGSSNSAGFIRKFVSLFGDSILESKATIISPSFIPKSKIREEQEIIQLVASATKETSFIKFNFTRIGDFWTYSMNHGCTLLITTKNYQADLAKVLFQFYTGKFWSGTLSFFLSI